MRVLRGGGFIAPLQTTNHSSVHRTFSWGDRHGRIRTHRGAFTRCSMPREPEPILFRPMLDERSGTSMEEFKSTYLVDKPQNLSKLGTTLGRFHFDGDVQDLQSDWDWSEAGVEVVTPVKD